MIAFAQVRTLAAGVEKVSLGQFKHARHGTRIAERRASPPFGRPLEADSDRLCGAHLAGSGTSGYGWATA